MKCYVTMCFFNAQRCIIDTKTTMVHRCHHFLYQHRAVIYEEVGENCVEEKDEPRYERYGGISDTMMEMFGIGLTDGLEMRGRDVIHITTKIYNMYNRRRFYIYFYNNNSFTTVVNL